MTKNDPHGDGFASALAPSRTPRTSDEELLQIADDPQQAVAIVERAAALQGRG